MINTDSILPLLAISFVCTQPISVNSQGLSPGFSRKKSIQSY